MQLRKYMRQIVAGVAILSIGALSLAAQAWSIPTTDPTATIKILSILDPKSDNMQPAIDAFQKEHPTITLKWQVVPFDSLNSIIDSHVANKSGDPDVYWADQPRISALASRGEAEELTAAFVKFNSTFDPTAYNAGLYDGKLWAMPIANSTQLLFYNKDLLKKAGLPFPSPAIADRMTWEDLAGKAAKAHAAGAQYGFAFGQFDRYYQLEILPVQLGGSVGASGTENLTPDFTSKEWVDAFTWYGKLFATGTSPR